MCEYCIRAEECMCSCEHTTIKQSNVFCNQCFHYVNEGKRKHEKKYGKVSEFERF